MLDMSDKNTKTLIPVVLCGGAGTRLWPLKGKKSFYNFFKTGSLLDLCLKRLKAFEPIHLLCTEELKPELEQSLKGKNYKTQILYEPLAKNTAISVAWLCYLLSKKSAQPINPILGIFPADHFIEKEQKFQKLLSKAWQLAQTEQKIVTFGIASNEPSSAYGHISVKKNNREGEVKKAIAFVEKPSLSQSTLLIQQGTFWNAGIFIAPLQVLIQQFKTHLPQVWNSPFLIIKNLKPSLLSIYKKLKPISFDKAVMENIKDFLCLPCDVGWYDLGSWEAIARWNQKFPGQLNNPENILTEELGTKWRVTPWGFDRILFKEEGFQYKQLKIKPGHQLSYQSHKYRKEHWLIITGTSRSSYQ